jgi:two-component system sensor histidine kinase PrrB
MLVENLLENAARHGRGDGVGGEVRVALGEGPTLDVDDDGPGVPEAERERIFEPFARAEGATAPGSGLGLALVAQQARAHGATIDVDRSPLGGARFRVRFGGAGASVDGSAEGGPAGPRAR